MKNKIEASLAQGPDTSAVMNCSYSTPYQNNTQIVHNDQSTRIDEIGNTTSGERAN